MASSWERLVSVTLGSNNATLSSGTFTAKKYLRIVFFGYKSGGSGDSKLRWNGDTGSNYARRQNTSSGSDTTGTSQSHHDNMVGDGGSSHFFATADVINVAGREKLVIIEAVNSATGAGNAPTTRESVVKWVNTADQITSCELSISGGDTYNTGSTITVWGADDQGSTTTAKDKSSITNVPDGTRYEEVDTRKIFHKRTQTGSGGGDLWVEKGNTFSASALRGFFSGGAASGSRNEIEYITIQTTANATDFGDLIDSREGSGACADATRCLDGHGNSIEYWTATTLGNATDFGDLSASRSPQGGGLADTTRGVFAGGNTTIDYVTIQTTGNATDFGDLQGGYSQTSACADATRGIIGGGWTGAYVDSIDYITIQSAGNAQDFGNLSAGKYALSACSDATRGVFTGGHTGSEINVIEYITIQTLGNTTDFGDLIASNTKHANCADSTRGVSAGGGGAENRIEYFTIQTTGNSTDFGDLVVGREVTGGCAA